MEGHIACSSHGISTEDLQDRNIKYNGVAPKTESTQQDQIVWNFYVVEIVGRGIKEDILKHEKIL